MPTERTLRRRLLLILLLPMLALLMTSLAVDYRIAVAPVTQAYDDALSADALALGGLVRVMDGKLQVDFSAAAEAVLRTDPNDQEFLSLYGPEGEYLAGDADLLPDPDSARSNIALSDAEFRGRKIRKASHQISTSAGIVIATVAETTRKRQKATEQILAGMIFPNILLIIATLGLVYVGIRNGLSPLIELSQEISRRPRHDLSPLPQSNALGEVQPLINAMNGLIEDQRSAALAQQVFLSNSAHQLKTPLAGLQSQLELHVQELPEEYRHRAIRLLDATHRLSHVTHQLLTLARAGPEADIAHEKRPLDLAELLESSASNWFNLALAKNIDLGFETEKAVIAGSEWLLREMFANIVDNALHYTPAGGCITVRSGVGADGRPFVEVEDNGPGIPEELCEQIFERFYRVPGTIGQGTGLGLAIVKEIAECHDATIALAKVSNAKGTRFRVLFTPCNGVARQTP